MKLITRDTDYAVRAICFIACAKNKSRGLVTAAELTRELKIPQPFLRKILQLLNKHGILHSYKGIGGGFVLGLRPEKIQLIDLIKIFQGRVELNECLFKKKICPNRGTCKLRGKINLIQEKVLDELAGITISDLLK